MKAGFFQEFGDGGPGEIGALAAGAGTIAELAAMESVCRACPRLVEWREQVAAEKRRSFQSEAYWGRPVPSTPRARETEQFVRAGAPPMR